MSQHGYVVHEDIQFADESQTLYVNDFIFVKKSQIHRWYVAHSARVLSSPAEYDYKPRCPVASSFSRRARLIFKSVHISVAQSFNCSYRRRNLCQLHGFVRNYTAQSIQSYQTMNDDYSTSNSILTMNVARRRIWPWFRLAHEMRGVNGYVWICGCFTSEAVWNLSNSSRQLERDDGEMDFGQKSHSTGQARIYHGSLTGSMLVCWWWWFDWSFARLIAPVVSCHN